MSTAAPNRPTAASPGEPTQVSIEAQKRSFLRMVSHELRTPLNSIIGFSEILSRELYGPLGAPQYREYAEHVRQSGLKLLHLVNQVLEIARLEGRMADLDPTGEPIDHALMDVIDQLRDEAAARGIRVRVIAEGPSPEAFVDARALRAILTNLLQNALTYSPEGGEVRVQVRRTGARVAIVIEDDGEGVDPAEIPRLMRPFEQGQNALTRSSQGAGLGLPIVALLCSAMGGVLRLESEPGQGLRATVVLPAA
jgi:signal transduction histidine kinase